MSASDFFNAGKLSEAIDAQIQEVKAHPADQSKRIFLFELLAFSGDLDRAIRQIDAVKYEEAELNAATLGYRKCLDAERLRRRLFSESLKPRFLTEPPDHLTLRLEAIHRMRENRPEEAAATLKEAAQKAPAITGVLNDKPFEVFHDCDDLFGTVLEVFAHGEYYWVPLEHVDTLVVKAPKFPRDLLWAPARLEVLDQAGDVFLPTLYPNSHLHEDPAIKLGRKTDWQPIDGGAVLGVGQRTFLVGDDAIGILEIRELEIGSGE